MPSPFRCLVSSAHAQLPVLSRDFNPPPKMTHWLSFSALLKRSPARSELWLFAAFTAAISSHRIAQPRPSIEWMKRHMRNGIEERNGCLVRTASAGSTVYSAKDVASRSDLVGSGMTIIQVVTSFCWSPRIHRV
jgi:hypothetical protein